MKQKQSTKKNFLKENLRTSQYQQRSPKKGGEATGLQSQANISHRGGASTAAGPRARDLSHDKSVSK